jgi:LysR family transcriptional regulator, glycine cleavage system transcriptional activator
MNNLIPPLKQLVALEAVAVHCSFTKAAKELNVTHSAISQSIKLLEKHLGYSLFERNTHMVKLTRIGEIYYNEVIQSLNIIKNATGRLVSGERTLTVNMQTTFAARWFNSRMEDFLEANPSIDFRLSTLRRKTRPPDFKNKQIDIAVDYGKRNDWEGCIEEKLIKDKLILVASPTIAREYKNLELKSVFKKHKCIMISKSLRKDDYKLWCLATSVEEPPPISHIYYLGTHQALNAVIKGDGVMVTHKIFVSDAIDNGLLLNLSEVETEESYFLIYPETSVNICAIDKFRKWIKKRVNNL